MKDSAVKMNVNYKSKITSQPLAISLCAVNFFELYSIVVLQSDKWMIAVIKFISLWTDEKKLNTQHFE